MSFGGLDPPKLATLVPTFGMYYYISPTRWSNIDSAIQIEASPFLLELI